MKNRILCFLAILSVLTLGVITTRAEDMNAVKARMSQRLGKIDELKSQGAIGENNRGFVELRGGTPAAGDVVASENKDREAVYAVIAQQNGSSPEAVGRARAKQIAAGSAAGVWVQKDNGEWAKK